MNLPVAADLVLRGLPRADRPHRLQSLRSRAPPSPRIHFAAVLITGRFDIPLHVRTRVQVSLALQNTIGKSSIYKQRDCIRRIHDSRIICPLLTVEMCWEHGSCVNMARPIAYRRRGMTAGRPGRGPRRGPTVRPGRPRPMPVSTLKLEPRHGIAHFQLEA